MMEIKNRVQNLKKYISFYCIKLFFQQNKCRNIKIATRVHIPTSRNYTEQSNFSFISHSILAVIFVICYFEPFGKTKVIRNVHLQFSSCQRKPEGATGKIQQHQVVMSFNQLICFSSSSVCYCHSTTMKFDYLDKE